MNASWAVISASAYGWVVGHQGLMLDEDSGLIYNRGRYLWLGIFPSRDPEIYDGGSLNLYEYVRSNPAQWTDPLGLSSYSPPDNEINSAFDALEWYETGGGTDAYLGPSGVNAITHTEAYQLTLRGVLAQIRYFISCVPNTPPKQKRFSGFTEIYPFTDPHPSSLLVFGEGTMILGYTVTYSVSSTPPDANGNYTVLASSIQMHWVLDKRWSFNHKSNWLSSVGNFFFQVPFGYILGGQSYRLHAEWDQALPPVSMTCCANSGQ
jgi:RHS repeat-associated protein